MTHLSDYVVLALLLAPYLFLLVIIGWVATLSARLDKLTREIKEHTQWKLR